MNDLLKQLTEIPSASGDEKAVRILLRDLIVDHVDEWQVDSIGNLIALKKGTGESDMRVMIDAHMDEIGLMITGIDSNGTLEFANLGGIDKRALAGQVVQVGKDKIPGVIGVKAIHLSKTAKERRQVPARLRIDIGATKKENAAGKVKVGDRATFLSEFTVLGDTAISKAFDDRAGCAAIVKLLQGEPYPFDLYASFTVQEEIGTLGAKVAAYRIKPDVAIVMECTPAYDLPNENDVSPNTQLGQGPCFYIMDRRTIQDPRLVKHLMESAESAEIPYQIRQPGGGGTNAGSIQRANLAVPVATIGLPQRYAHTANGMIHLGDFDNYIKVADAGLRRLTRAVIARG